MSNPLDNTTTKATNKTATETTTKSTLTTLKMDSEHRIQLAI